MLAKKREFRTTKENICNWENHIEKGGVVCGFAINPKNSGGFKVSVNVTNWPQLAGKIQKIIPPW